MWVFWAVQKNVLGWVCTFFKWLKCKKYINEKLSWFSPITHYLIAALKMFKKLSQKHRCWSKILDNPPITVYKQLELETKKTEV